MKLYLDGKRLKEVALANRDRYASARPFPHIVLDNVFPEEALDGVLHEFPKAKSPVWKEYGNYHEKKLETQGEEKVSVFTSLLLYQFNSAPFLQFLETLTGVEDIISDPYFYGGGLHQIPPGGKLGIHADFSRHGKYPLDRRLNILIYLNKDWKEEYGRTLGIMEHRYVPVCPKNSSHLQSDGYFQHHRLGLPRPPGAADLPGRDDPQVHRVVLLHQWET